MKVFSLKKRMLHSLNVFSWGEEFHPKSEVFSFWPWCLAGQVHTRGSSQKVVCLQLPERKGEKLKTRKLELGQRVGHVCQAWGLEFDPWDPRDGRESLVVLWPRLAHHDMTAHKHIYTQQLLKDFFLSLASSLSRSLTSSLSTKLKVKQY